MHVVEPVVIAVCGLKKSGKSTLIQKMIPVLNQKGYKVAVIKHDGHDFEGDVPGTDSFRHQKAGAYGTAVYSSHKFLVTKQQEEVDEKELIRFFPEADLILLEGLKNSTYPKIEVIRKEKGNAPVSNPEGRFLIVTDACLDIETEKILLPEDIEGIVEEICKVWKRTLEVDRTHLID